MRQVHRTAPAAREQSLFIHRQAMKTDRSAFAIRAQGCVSAIAIGKFAGLAVVVVAVAWCAPARALIVGTTSNVVPATASAPNLNQSWGVGDPGWANVAHLGYYQPQYDQTWYKFTGTYLGDGWFLTANHVGVPTAIQFDNNGTIYKPIPGQVFSQDSNGGIANPSWSDNRLTSPTADLMLFRINGDPGLPSISIATQGLSVGDEVVKMGWGFVRYPEITYFTVNKADPNNWQYTQLPQGQTCSGSNCYPGFWYDGNNSPGKRWGTNRVENSDNVLQGDHDGIVQTVTNNGTTIAYVTTYDQNSGDPYESLDVGGDSGSPVFFYRNGQWRLQGIVESKWTYPGQTPGFDSSNGLALFGNVDGFADLSKYAANIAAVIATHPNYSAVGDLNLDGTPGGADDIAAFVAGWRYNNGTGAGTMTSWMHGDLNHDGKVDVSDFLLMRTGISAAAGAQLAALLGDELTTGVPEPASILLLVVPGAFLVLRGRRRLQP